MVILFFVILFALLLVGFLGYSFYRHEERIKKQSDARVNKERASAYELAILKEIQDRIGYELDLEKVVTVITGSLRNLFYYSTASSVIFKNDSLVFTSYLEESVSREFINQVKKTMLASLSYLSGKTIPDSITENITGVIRDDTQKSLPSSFFNIPLVVNDTVVGIINVSSVKAGLYKEEEMTILYKISNQASTALTRLEQVLQTEKGKLMAMTQSLKDGVFMVDTKNELLIINNAAKEMLSLSKQNVTTLDILQALEGKYALALRLREVMTNKQSIDKKEITLGSKIVKIFITPVTDSKSHTVIGASVLLQDITIEKNLSRMKEDFTSMMVHELRAPLTAIRGAAQLLETQSRNAIEPEESKMLGVISEQSTRMLNEVNSLLDASKLEAGKFSLQKEQVAIGSIIEEKVNFFMPEATEKHIQLLKHLEADLPVVAADPYRIGQVLNNLLSNSLKYTHEGGHIQVSAIREGNNLIITVSDSGIGIPKEKQEALFSKFSQVMGGTHTAGSSTGLGLYIAKGIVQAHEGTISLESELGRGTRIRFSLPLHVPLPQDKTDEQFAQRPIITTSNLVN